MRIITYIFLILILLLGISFAILNAEPVAINYYFSKHTLPLSLLLVLTFCFGCILGLIVGMVMMLKVKYQNFKLRNRIKLAEKEIENLRTMPLQDNR